MSFRFVLLFGALLTGPLSANIFAQSGSSFDPATYEGASIGVGKGGGFAGTVREYRLLDSGHLYVKEPGSASFRLLKKKSKRKTLLWFYELERTGIRCIDFQSPGNVYQYITLMDKEVEKKVVWGSTEGGVPQEIVTYYSRFMDYWTK